MIGAFSELEDDGEEAPLNPDAADSHFAAIRRRDMKRKIRELLTCKQIDDLNLYSLDEKALAVILTLAEEAQHARNKP